MKLIRATCKEGLQPIKAKSKKKRNKQSIVMKKGKVQLSNLINHKKESNVMIHRVKSPVALKKVVAPTAPSSDLTLA